jgi:alkylation response protein AidB-like acyl-CoA dehydrogenase
MRFRFTDEQLLIRSEVRALLEREWTSAHLRSAWDSDEPALGLRRQLATLGVFGITMPERFGGIGGARRFRGASGNRCAAPRLR